MFRQALAAVAVLFGASHASAAGQSAHDFSFRSIDGQPLPLSAFAGKAVLVVNTASECGFTPQYAELEQLWRGYRDRGLVVLAVPSNDFGGQEPGTAEEIAAFCTDVYGIGFPVADKERVKGADAHPFYRWAADQVGVLGVPRWNFHKYLVAPDGRLVEWFSTPTKPTAGRVVTAIEKVLPPTN